MPTKTTTTRKPAKVTLTPAQKAAQTKRKAGTLSKIALKAAQTRKANQKASKRKTGKKAPKA